MSNDAVCFSPFFDHVLGYWDKRDDPQVLFLKYEDMKKVTATNLRALSNNTTICWTNVFSTKYVNVLFCILNRTCVR